MQLQKIITIQLKSIELIRPKFYFYLAIFIPFMFNSCKNYVFEAELRQLDSLININNSAKETMVVDSEVIKIRINSMQHSYSIIQTLDSTKFNQELKYDINKFRGILNIYTEFVDKYDVLEYDNLVYSESLHELKIKLVENTITKEEFIKIFNEKRYIILNHLKEAKRLVKSIYSVEEIYKRINPKISNLCSEHEKKTNNQ